MTIKAPITVEGNLTHDPELHYSDTGQPYARLSLAVNDRHYNSETEQSEDVGGTIFHRATVFG